MIRKILKEVTIQALPEPKVEPSPPVDELKFDIDLKDPETIKAATLIQAGFRSLGARREISQMHKAASRIQAGFRSKQTRVILNTMKTALATDFTDSESDSQDDLTESSVSVSEKSANAPIRNKKVPFGLIRKILKNNQDSVVSVRGSEDEDTIKEIMTEKQDKLKQDVKLDLQNDAPGADGVHELHTKSEELEDTDTEFLEEDLQDDWTESSVSVSEKSANAPIRNKKVPFGVIRRILKNNQDSVPSVRGSDDEDTIKENMAEKQEELDLHNDPAPGVSTNGVDKSQAKSEEPEDKEAEFLEEDLHDDWTESSASVSEKSANAPIRNKKTPFGLIRKILKD